MTNLQGQLNELISDDASWAEYKYELAISGFTNDLARLMTEQGVTQSELARRLGVSRARVSQLLQHKSSPTLRTMVQAASALGCEVGLGLGMEGCSRFARQAGSPDQRRGRASVAREDTLL